MGKEEQGRRNSYSLHVDLTLRHPAEARIRIRDLLAIFD